MTFRGRGGGEGILDVVSSEGGVCKQGGAKGREAKVYWSPQKRCCDVLNFAARHLPPLLLRNHKVRILQHRRRPPQIDRWPERFR